MKFLYPVVFCGLFLSACSDEQTAADSVISDTPKTTQELLDSILWKELEKDVVCDVHWDTITNPNYLAHKIIMERYFVPGKRGWWMTGKDDTLDTYLYPQDIGIFFQELDSTEQGMYRMWTNQIVFRILYHDAGQMMSLPFTMSKDEGAYFLWHVAHPMCNDFPIDSTIARVEKNMEDEGNMKGFKEEVLSRLNDANK